MTLLRFHKLWMVVIFLGFASLTIAQTPVPHTTHEVPLGTTSTPNPHYLASDYYPVVVARDLIERGEIITRDNLSVVQV